MNDPKDPKPFVPPPVVEANDGGAPMQADAPEDKQEDQPNKTRRMGEAGDGAIGGGIQNGLSKDNGAGAIGAGAREARGRAELAKSLDAKPDLGKDDSFRGPTKIGGGIKQGSSKLDQHLAAIAEEEAKAEAKKLDDAIGKALAAQQVGAQAAQDKAVKDLRDQFDGQIALIMKKLNAPKPFVPPPVFHDNDSEVISAVAQNVSPDIGEFTESASGDFSSAFDSPAWPFGIETNPDILVRSVGGITVKDGFSGIYKVDMLVFGEVNPENNDYAKLTVTCTVGGTPNDLEWILRREISQYTEGSFLAVSKTELTTTVSAAVFVDASAGDVLISANWNVDIGGSGEVRFQIKVLTVTLLELRDDAIAT